MINENSKQKISAEQPLPPVQGNIEAGTGMAVEERQNVLGGAGDRSQQEGAKGLVVNQGVRVVEDRDEFFKGKSNEAIKKMIEEVKGRIKNLYTSNFKMDMEAREVKSIIAEHQSQLDRQKAMINDPESHSEELISIAKRKILEELGDQEKEVVGLELKVLDMPNIKSNDLLKRITREFGDRLIGERNKNKQLGVYIKQEYLDARKAEVLKVREEVDKLKSSINRKIKKIQDFEYKQLKYLQSISALNRFIAVKRQERIQLEAKVNETQEGMKSELEDIVDERKATNGEKQNQENSKEQKLKKQK